LLTFNTIYVINTNKYGATNCYAGKNNTIALSFFEKREHEYKIIEEDRQG
jgi:predicted acetyltransferase